MALSPAELGRRAAVAARSSFAEPDTLAPADFRVYGSPDRFLLVLDLDGSIEIRYAASMDRLYELVERIEAEGTHFFGYFYDLEAMTYLEVGDSPSGRFRKVLDEIPVEDDGSDPRPWHEMAA